MLSFDALVDVVHYSTFINVFFGMLVILWRARMSVGEFFSVSCTTVRASELSAFVTYMVVLFTFVCSTFLEYRMMENLFPTDPAIIPLVEVWAKDQRLMVFYLSKMIIELCMLIFLLYGHKVRGIALGTMAKMIAFFTVVIAIVHFARCIDRVVLQTNFMGGVYSPLILSINLCGSLVMLLYIPALITKDRFKLQS